MKRATDTTLVISGDYRQFIEEMKARVTSARISAARAITHEAILLYWDIGRGIVDKQKTHGWGESVIEQVSADLQAALPGLTGYSPRNLRSARQLYLTYGDPTIWLQPVARLAKQPGGTEIWLQAVAELNSHTVIAFLRQLVAEIPWGQNLLILNKLNDPAARLWYLPVVLPSVVEQQAICDHIDTKLGELKKVEGVLETQIATLTSYRKSLIHECVTGQRRITDAEVRVIQNRAGNLARE